MSTQSPVAETIDHLFRHEYGRLTSVLTRIFGTRNLELAEDVVQDTLLKALEQWRFSGIPNNPSGWLYKVARNKALDIIRRNKVQQKFADDVAPLLKSEYTLIPVLKELFDEAEIRDDVLRMMFACCNPEIPSESQVALILKTLCGFNIEEISRAFLAQQETINKRLYRARQQFRSGDVKFEIPSSRQLEDRLDNVLTSLYLLFNEGYNSSHSDHLIRNDLVEEACRLCYLLTENPKTDLPQVNALLALMLMHASRLKARLDADENILLLEKQDRALWDRELIRRGVFFFERALTEEPSSYHLQASIALQHVMAPTFEETDWPSILHLYNLLTERFPSPVVWLNRAIVVSRIEGPQKALEEIEKIPGIEKLSNYYLLPATLGDLNFRLKKYKEAYQYFEKAFSLTQSNAEKKLLRGKMNLCKWS